MFTGAHFLFYSTDPEGDRAFFRDVLDFRNVDVGGGWLIFKLPPAEAAVHPSEGRFVQRHADHDLIGCVMYLMCDDLRSTIGSLKTKQITCSAVVEADWGMSTTFRLPSGAHLGLYQPSHPTALAL
jgi:hypothetical protein